MNLQVEINSKQASYARLVVKRKSSEVNGFLFQKS